MILLILWSWWSLGDPAGRLWSCWSFVILLIVGDPDDRWWSWWSLVIMMIVGGPADLEWPCRSWMIMQIFCHHLSHHADLMCPADIQWSCTHWSILKILYGPADPLIMQIYCDPADLWCWSLMNDHAGLEWSCWSSVVQMTSRDHMQILRDPADLSCWCCAMLLFFRKSGCS